MNRHSLAVLTIGCIYGLGIGDVLAGFPVTGMLLIGLGVIVANLINWDEK